MSSGSSTDLLVDSLRATNPVQTAFLALIIANHLVSPLDNHWIAYADSNATGLAFGWVFALAEVAWLYLFNLVQSSTTVFVSVLVLHISMMVSCAQTPVRSRGGLSFYAAAVTSAGLNACLFIGAAELPATTSHEKIEPFKAPLYGLFVIMLYIALKAITKDIVTGEMDNVAVLPDVSIGRRLQGGVALIILRTIAPRLLGQHYYVLAHRQNGTMALATDGAVLPSMSAKNALWLYELNALSLAVQLLV